VRVRNPYSHPLRAASKGARFLFSLVPAEEHSRFQLKLRSNRLLVPDAKLLVLSEGKRMCHIVLGAFAASTRTVIACPGPRRMISIRCALLCPYKAQLESLSIWSGGRSPYLGISSKVGGAWGLITPYLRHLPCQGEEQWSRPQVWIANDQDAGKDGHRSRDQR
jgi:hypothetical protein